MCRGTTAPDLQAAAETSLVLERLRQQLAGAGNCAAGVGGPANGFPGLCGVNDLGLASRGSGPRLFCGHVPPVRLGPLWGAPRGGFVAPS